MRTPNYLLQNNVPIKWATKPGKAKVDEDFTAGFFTDIPAIPSRPPERTSIFPAGPFIISPEYGGHYQAGCDRFQQHHFRNHG
ncbi:MAG: hypothetical protein IPN69_17680 [Acidobacteria bacterium]|nr:hypothetical protein [Acidobacteriota bacterium]